MRKMPVLTMVCLVALGLAAAPTFAATGAANDVPDIVLSAGETSSFDLADFFSEGPYGLSGGGSIDGSVVTVDGSASPVTFTGGADSDDSEVIVSSFVLNDIEVDDNNRIVGKDGGNIFYNPIVPGGVIESWVNLNLPEGGSSVSPGGETGAAGASLIATVATVDGVLTDVGDALVPVLNEDGSYSVTAGAGYAGTWIVTLGAVDGASMDAVHLLAAEAVAVDVAGFTGIPAGTPPLPEATLAGGVVTAAAGQAKLAFGAPIEVGAPGDVVTLTADYTATASANVALVLFDGALGAVLAHTNPSGGNIATGVTKSLSMSMVTYTGTVIPGFQVVAGDAAATVTIANMAVVKAGPVTDYALNKGATAFADDFDDGDISDWGSDILGTGALAPTADSGAMKLAGAGGIANAHMMVPLQAGTAVAECYASASGAGTFAVVLTDGGALSSETFVSGLGADASKVIAVGTPSAPTTGILVIQAAGMDAMVDDVSVRIVDEPAGAADLSLLGL
ncbi:MAG: hypothetical protein JXR73_04575 [Candidatus Omnitrophica bacterium]|nr:hypothetical protein [Candidatus Omnitrophota bacterium]